MLLVCTPAGLDKQGVRNEIEIASQLAVDLHDREFIIPLRLEQYQAPFRIAQAQYVDFSRSWGAGLTELVGLLIDVHKIPRRSGQAMGDWLNAQSLGATRLIQHPERLTSNWLIFRRLPRLIRYCEPRAGFSIERFQNKTLHHWPVIPFNAGVVTFASPDGDGSIAANMPARMVYELPVRSFLDVGWEQLKIPVYEARRQFSDLGNQAFENFLQSRGLTSNERTRDRRVWWGNIRTFPLTQVRFDWPRQSGRRQIIGVSAKRRMHWHYAVSAQVRTAPMRHLRLSAGLIFSDNGLDALADAKGMHRLRRSFAKSWRNARWRDMLLAFLWWLGEGRSEIELRVSHRQRMILGLPTVSFTSPASVLHEGEDPPDEDDPDVDLDERDEDDEEISEDQDVPQ